MASMLRFEHIDATPLAARLRPQTLDEFVGVMREIAREAAEDPETVKAAPLETPIRKPDDTAAALNPVVTYAEL